MHTPHRESMEDVVVVLATCQEIIRKRRIRIQEFFVDFDRLRSGLVYPNHFVSALGIAGVDKALTVATPINDNDLTVLKKHYIVQKEGCPEMVDYRSFCEHVNKGSQATVTKKKTVEQCLSNNQQERIDVILGDIAEICHQKGHSSILRSPLETQLGLLVKPMFVDFANSNNSTKLVGHVTKQQFHRVLDVKLGVKISEADAELLCLMFSNPDYEEMVNYVDFSNAVLPEQKPYNPYTDM